MIRIELPVIIGFSETDCSPIFKEPEIKIFYAPKMFNHFDKGFLGPGKIPSLSQFTHRNISIDKCLGCGFTGFCVFLKPESVLGVKIEPIFQALI